MANAENNHEMDRGEPVCLRRAVATPAPPSSACMPRAQGSYNRILKRTTHITIGVSEKA
ncbi:MAG: large ribosomal subunit protein uL22 [Oscillospiraceae bacterium]